MRLYLDVCCLNRPFDNPSQERIRLESEAVLLILQRIQTGEWKLISSEMVEDEIEQTPNAHRRERLKILHAHAHEVVHINSSIVNRAKELVAVGFTSEDAIHLACTESDNVDCFLTTDDKLRRRASGLIPPLFVNVANPLTWLIEKNL